MERCGTGSLFTPLLQSSFSLTDMHAGLGGGRHWWRRRPEPGLQTADFQREVLCFVSWEVWTRVTGLKVFPVGFNACIFLQFREVDNLCL